MAAKVFSSDRHSVLSGPLYCCALAKTVFGPDRFMLALHVPSFAGQDGSCLTPTTTPCQRRGLWTPDAPALRFSHPKAKSRHYAMTPGFSSGHRELCRVRRRRPQPPIQRPARRACNYVWRDYSKCQVGRAVVRPWQALRGLPLTEACP